MYKRNRATKKIKILEKMCFYKKNYSDLKFRFSFLFTFIDRFDLNENISAYINILNRTILLFLFFLKLHTLIKKSLRMIPNIFRI